jgi:hypothetical protein
MKAKTGYMTETYGIKDLAFITNSVLLVPGFKQVG